MNLDQDVPRWLADGSGFLWISERERRPAAGAARPRRPAARACWSRPRPGLPAAWSRVRPKTRPVRLSPPAPTRRRAHLFRVAGSTAATAAHALEGAPACTRPVSRKDQSTSTSTRRAATRMPRTTVHDARRHARRRAAVGRRGAAVRAAAWSWCKVGDDAGFHAAVVRPRDFDAEEEVSR